MRFENTSNLKIGGSLKYYSDLTKIQNIFEKENGCQSKEQILYYKNDRDQIDEDNKTLSDP